MKHHRALYIDGQWTEVSAPSIPIVNPTNREVIAEVPAAHRGSAEAAATAAAKAFPGWAATSSTDRADALQRIADGLLARASELTQTITAEVGMPVKLSERIQVGMPLDAWNTYARMAGHAAAEQRVGHSKVIAEPIGPVACITPWNLPLHQVTAKVAAALAAGASVVLKPSEVAPLSAFILAEVIDAAELPPGVFNLVTGYGPEVGEALISQPEIAMISFTGSTRAGKRVAALAAEGVKRLSLELGGKSPSIVLDGAELGAAVKATLASCFLNSGQTCNALSRLIVPEDRFDETSDLIVERIASFTLGDPMAPETRMGPLVSADQFQRVNQHLEAARDIGIPVIAEGPAIPEGLDGFFMSPRVFGPVAPDAPLAQEEIFGPVLSMMTHKGEDDAIRIANATPYGLAAAVWAEDDAAAERVARHIRAGQIDLNGAPFNLNAPFGGFGASGIGRENGHFGLEEFTELKSIQIRESRP